MRLLMRKFLLLLAPQICKFGLLGTSLSMHSHLNLGLPILTEIGLRSDIYEDTYYNQIQALVSNGQKAIQEDGEYMKVVQLAILGFSSQPIHQVLQEC
jgi:hypothetical protein